MKKYALILLSIFILCGCNLQSGNQPDHQTREKVASFITALEQELQVMDSLSSRAISPLISENSTLHGETPAAITEKFQRAKRQISAAAIMLEEKVIPVQVPTLVRDELLVAQNDLLRAYRIKLKSIDILKEYQATKKPYLLDQYRNLSAESAATGQEAKSCISKARKLAETN